MSKMKNLLRNLFEFLDNSMKEYDLIELEEAGFKPYYK
jgi:hypothetical protein